jgi:hypothetical protein
MEVIHVAEKDDLLQTIAETYGKGIADKVNEETLLVIFSLVDESGREIRLGSRKS